MAFNINSSINMKSINKVGNIANNTVFKDKFYDDVEKGIYTEIDYSNDASINIEKGIETSPEKIEEETASKKTTTEKETGASWWDYCRTIVGGAVEGFLGVGEGLVDGHIYATGVFFKGLTAGYLDDEWAKDAVGYDVSGKVENAITYGVNEDIKNSTWNSIPTYIGEGGGYAALSSIPFCGIVAAAIGGAGKEVEKSINTQMKETGTVNDWNVFFKSVQGSLEGFAFSKLSQAGATFKKMGANGVKEGTAKMFEGGIKSGITNFIKSTPTVFKSTGLNCLKDPHTWAQTGAETIKKIYTIYETGNFNLSDLFIIPVKFWDNMGAAGLNYLK